MAFRKCHAWRTKGDEKAGAKRRDSRVRSKAKQERYTPIIDNRPGEMPIDHRSNIPRR